MEVTPLAIPEVKLITPRRFGDHRGFFSETYNKRALAAQGIHFDFLQDNHAFSATRGTLRGLHFQVPPMAQDKLLRVTRGAIVDVAVDIRQGSPTYGQHVAVELSAENWAQLLVPAGFAHGYCTLVPDTEVLYKVTAFYSREHERGLQWDDPGIGIDWRIPPAEAILSDKDKSNPTLADLPAYFTWEA